jgi:hypothetical protein
VTTPSTNMKIVIWPPKKGSFLTGSYGQNPLRIAVPQG